MRRSAAFLVALLLALALAGPAAAQAPAGEGKTVAPVEGASFTGVVASFSNVSCPPSGCAATIDWGDGTPAADGTVTQTDKSAYDVSGTHTYEEEGSYTITVNLHDRAQTSATGKADVSDAALTGTPVTFSTTVGDAFTGTVATFTDADPNGTANDYHVDIVWGDGQDSTGTVSPNSSGGFDAIGSHTYTIPGPHSVTVTINDSGGANTTVMSSATVSNGAGPPAATKPAILTGLDSGGSTNVRLFGIQGNLLMSFFPFATLNGGARVAAGNFNGQKGDDYVAGVGPGGGSPQVSVLLGGVLVRARAFDAYDPAFTGGVYVAVGDVNGDGWPDIVTGPGAGAGPHVNVFSGKDGKLLRSFFAYDANFKGGVRVAAGDVNGDGFADIVTGAGPGGGPHVKVFDGTTGKPFESYEAFAASFTGGVYVAAGDVNGDGRADVIAGAGPGGGPHVKVLDSSGGKTLHSFLAFDPSFTGGVSVAAGDLNGDGRADVIVGAGPGGGPHVKTFSGITGNLLSSFEAYAPDVTQGVLVGASPGFVPAVQQFVLTRTVFRVARFRTPRSAAARVPRGTTFRFVLNGSAKVKITIAKRHHKRWRKVAVLRRHGKRGPNKVRFSGRIGKKALKPGRYRAAIAAGSKLPPKRVKFRIVAG